MNNVYKVITTIDNNIITMQSIQTIYNVLSNVKKKERFDIILEPLQAILQLSFLSHCPIGSKLSIENNLLFVQTPTWHQGVARSWNRDNKQDVLLLFNAVQRFTKFYRIKFINENSVNDKFKQKLFTLLIESACNGIDNLLQTYSRSDNPTILQTLHMYKNVLMHPEKFIDIETVDSNMFENEKSKKIENVFSNITEVWNDNELHIIYNTLKLMELEKDNYEKYMQGLNLIFEPVYIRICKWISDNIVY